MRPPVWHSPVALSPAEQTMVARLRRATLVVFLRQRRHELFTEAFQAEWATIFRDRPKGQPPIPPAQLALVTILQAYTGASDDEAIEALTMDRRWQLVLDCLDCRSSVPPVRGAGASRSTLTSGCSVSCGSGSRVQPVARNCGSVLPLNTPWRM
jgi:hypothetical protein